MPPDLSRSTSIPACRNASCFRRVGPPCFSSAFGEHRSYPIPLISSGVRSGPVICFWRNLSKFLMPHSNCPFSSNSLSVFVGIVPVSGKKEGAPGFHAIQCCGIWYLAAPYTAFTPSSRAPPAANGTINSGTVDARWASCAVQLRIAVWTGDARDTRPKRRHSPASVWRVSPDDPGSCGI